MPPPPGRLVLVNETTGRPVDLARAGAAGGSQSTIWNVTGQPNLIAAVALAPAGYSPADTAKLRALVDRKVTHSRVAYPHAVLVQHAGAAAAAGFLMERFAGEGLDVVTVPAEQARLKVLRTEAERMAAVVSLAQLFGDVSRVGDVLVDHNPSNLILGLKNKTLYKVDPLSIAFEHNGYHGTGVARPEYLPPELQRFVRAGTLAGERLSETLDRFALACLAFLILTSAAPTDYTGGDPDPGRRVESRKFACVSEPAGCVVSPNVRIAFFSLPKAVQNLIHDGLMADPHRRPSPGDWLAALRTRARAPSSTGLTLSASGGARWARNFWPYAAAAGLAGAALWGASSPPTPVKPAHAPPATKAKAADPDAWKQLTKRVGDP